MRFLILLIFLGPCFSKDTWHALPQSFFLEDLWESLPRQFSLSPKAQSINDPTGTCGEYASIWDSKASPHPNANASKQHHRPKENEKELCNKSGTLLDADRVAEDGTASDDNQGILGGLHSLRRL